MPLAADLHILWQLLRGARQGGSHAERLERFYRPQAATYDAFREKLLRGRRELIEQLAPPDNAHIVELGAGTGRNIAFFGTRLARFAAVDLVDLCPALLDQARMRWSHEPRVRVIAGDAAEYRPARAADCVILSYALTMMPQWSRVISNAVAMLKPGGLLGIVDFTLPPGRSAGARFAGHFWRRWFAHDGVYLDLAHLDVLQSLTTPVCLQVENAPLPYLPLLRAPYYLYIGRKPSTRSIAP